MTVTTLSDGGQQPATVAQALHDFLAAARTSLDIATYDFELGPGPRGARRRRDRGRRQAGSRGAARLQRGLSRADPGATAAEDRAGGHRAADACPTKPIAGIPDLMHHKYVVRDGASVWTGSTNWTDDSWSREENVIVGRSTRRSSRMPSRSTSSSSGRRASSRSPARSSRGRSQVGRDRGAAVVLPRLRRRALTPDREGDRPRQAAGPDLLAGDHRRARSWRRWRRCSPTARSTSPARSTRRRSRRCTTSGARRASRSWKLPLLQQVIASGHFAGKRSTPWGPGTVHDYMHAKMTVADDVVFLGSFNLSHSGEMNAENVLEIHDPALAERLAGFVDAVRARYPVANLDPARRRRRQGVVHVAVDQLRRAGEATSSGWFSPPRPTWRARPTAVPLVRTVREGAHGENRRFPA